MDSVFIQYLNDVDALIKAGQVEKAREKLRKLNRNKLDRDHAPRFASLCRRVRLQDISLLALRPYVRASDRRVVESTNEEKAEYAAALTDLGATKEALDLLNQVSAEEFPLSLLYKSFALFTRWEYAEAVPLLDKYLQTKSLTESAHIVGQANLASALLFTDDKRAEETINTLLEKTRIAKYTIAEGYTEMLKAEWLMTHCHFKQSAEALHEAHKIFSNPASIEFLLTKKWDAILNLHQDKKKNSAQIKSVREDAAARKHWETLRHCDYFEAIVLKDAQLLQKLYFGTPYPAFHRKLFREFGPHEDMPSLYDWNSSENVNPSAKTVELFPEKANGKLKLGKANYRVLRSLCGDFYKPLRIAELHAEIFKGDYFNPESSIARVHQALRRARIFIKKNKLPLEIVEVEGRYLLKSQGGHPIRVPHFTSPLEGNELLFSQLKQTFSAQAFTLKQAEEALKFKNRWATQRLLQWAMQNSRLVQFGKGSKTRYQIADEVASVKKAA